MSKHQSYNLVLYYSAKYLYLTEIEHVHDSLILKFDLLS